MPRVLTCTDGSVYAHSVYHYSAWAAKQLADGIHVLHMLDPLHEDPLNAELLSGDADALILKAVEHDGADLLVMGAFGHSRIRQMIVGSTTSNMIRKTKRPVLLFR